MPHALIIPAHPTGRDMLGHANDATMLTTLA